MKVRNSYIITMNAKIVRSTSKGQITLPMEWRKNFKTDTYVIEFDNKKIVVKPLDMEVVKEEVLFDAERDNKGKGVSVDEMIKMLKKIK